MYAKYFSKCVYVHTYAGGKGGGLHSGATINYFVVRLHKLHQASRVKTVNFPAKSDQQQGRCDLTAGSLFYAA